MNTSLSEVVFLDSSAILRYLTGDSRARKVIEESRHLAVNSIVYSEVAFNILKLLYTKKYGRYKFYGMKSRIAKRDNELLEAYWLLEEFLSELLREGRLLYLPITFEIVKEAGHVAIEYGLLPKRVGTMA